MADRKSRTKVPVKRRYKVRVMGQPLPTTPTTSVPVDMIPTPMVARVYCIHPDVCSKISSQVHTSDGIQLDTKGKFEGVPYPTGRPHVEENPSAPNFNPPQAEAIPNTPTFQVREETPWPNTMPTPTNLFGTRADWPVPPMPTPTVKIERTQVPPRVAAIPSHTVLPKPQHNRSAEEKCTCRPHCPICKKEEGDSTEEMEW